ncbi:MAG: ABC transporter ATP-binding protein [Vicinamibacteria bacterium]
MASAIEVRKLGKQFRRFHRNRPSTLQEAVFRGLRGLGRIDRFWALRDVDFDVAEGRMLGVLGVNGAGKSTLLRLIGGVGKPDEGTVRAKGRIGGLLGLGVGFHPELTGRENVFVNGVICGLRRSEVSERFDSIVGFAELEEFIDHPLRTYSSGMQLRLAFAIAVHIQAAILLIDEVLAVGDLRFRQKCLERIMHLKDDGGTIVLVSHDTELLARLCDEALWLSSGRVEAHGPPRIVVQRYEREMMGAGWCEDGGGIPGGDAGAAQKRSLLNVVHIVSVRLLDGSASPVSEVSSGDPLRIEIEYLAHRRLDASIFGATLSSADGFVFHDTSSESSGLRMNLEPGKGRVGLVFDRLDLMGGSYFVDVGVYEKDWAAVYDYHWHKYPIRVRAIEGEKGVLRPPHRWEVLEP